MQPGRSASPAPAARATRSATGRARRLQHARYAVILQLPPVLGRVSVTDAAHQAMRSRPRPLAVLLDLGRVTEVDLDVEPLLAELVADLGGFDCAVAWSHPGPWTSVLDGVDAQLAAQRLGAPVRHPDLGHGIAWLDEVVGSRLVEPGEPLSRRS